MRTATQINETWHTLRKKKVSIQKNINQIYFYFALSSLAASKLETPEKCNVIHGIKRGNRYLNTSFSTLIRQISHRNIQLTCINLTQNSELGKCTQIREHFLCFFFFRKITKIRSSKNTTFSFMLSRKNLILWYFVIQTKRVTTHRPR